MYLRSFSAWRREKSISDSPQVLLKRESADRIALLCDIAYLATKYRVISSKVQDRGRNCACFIQWTRGHQLLHCATHIFVLGSTSLFKTICLLCRASLNPLAPSADLTSLAFTSPFRATMLQQSFGSKLGPDQIFQRLLRCACRLPSKQIVGGFGLAS